MCIYIYIYTHIHLHKCKYVYIYIYIYDNIYIYWHDGREFSSGCRCGRFPKFHRVFGGRDSGTLKSDIVSNKHPQLVCSDLRLSNWKFEDWNYGNRPHRKATIATISIAINNRLLIAIDVYIYIYVYTHI